MGFALAVLAACGDNHGASGVDASSDSPFTYEAPTFLGNPAQLLVDGAPSLPDAEGIHRLTYSFSSIEVARDHQSDLTLRYPDGVSLSTRVGPGFCEIWATERDVDLRGFGGTTFRNDLVQRGLEPDECYKLGALREGDIPDIAIEIIVTSGLVDKMAVTRDSACPRCGPGAPTRARSPSTG